MKEAVPTQQKHGRDLSTESRLVLASAGGPSEDELIRNLLGGGIDWGRLSAISLREGAQPVLGRRIRECDCVEVPRAVSAHLRHIERTSEFRQRYLERRLLETLQTLSDTGIPVMLLKGAAVAHLVFADFTERPMSDIDLLVHPDDVSRAHSALISVGWAPRFSPDFDGWYAGMHHLPPLTDARSPALQVGLDLHTQLFPEQRNPFSFEAADMWREARQIEDLPPGCHSSSLENHLLHSSLHHAWSHRLSAAGWRTFRDTSAIAALPGFQWSEFVERVDRSGARTPIYWSLSMARALAGARVPDVVLQRLRPQRRKAIINLLERHFVHEAVEAERLCPSDRLRTMIWVAAMDGSARIRVAAEPDHRPWRRLQRESSNEKAPAVWKRPALRPSAWAGYLRALVRIR